MEEFELLSPLLAGAVVSLVVAAFMAGRASAKAGGNNIVAVDSTDLECGYAVVPRALGKSEDDQREAFFQFTTLVLDELPILLRKYFRHCWDDAYGASLGPWTESESDGDAFWNGVFDQDKWFDVCVHNGSNVVQVLSPVRPGVPSLSPGDKVRVGHCRAKVMSVKGDSLYLNDMIEYADATLPLTGQCVPYERNADARMARHFRPLVLAGDSSGWDISLLCFALLNSSHELLRGREAHATHLHALRELRNSRLAHVQRCRMERSELKSSVQVMDSFVRECMPCEWEQWHAVSRAVLQQRYLAQDRQQHTQHTQHTQQQQQRQLQQQLQQHQQQRASSALDRQQQRTQQEHKSSSGSHSLCTRQPSQQQQQHQQLSTMIIQPAGSHMRAMLSAASSSSDVQHIRKRQEAISQQFWREAASEVY